MWFSSSFSDKQLKLQRQHGKEKCCFSGRSVAWERFSGDSVDCGVCEVRWSGVCLEMFGVWLNGSIGVMVDLPVAELYTLTKCLILCVIVKSSKPSSAISQSHFLKCSISFSVMHL